MKWKLKRTTQCGSCPWRVDVDPYDIPNGYTLERHKALRSTISEGVESLSNQGVMACHLHNTEDEVHCIGWLMNQAGPGNNIGLRLSLMGCENINSVKLRGEQHATFEDTIPTGEPE